MSLLDDLAAKLPFFKQAQPADYFLALNISSTLVTGMLWEVSGDRVDILSQKTEGYTGHDELFEKANIALDQAIGQLGVEPSKILLGVPDNWLEDEDLKEPYLELLRRMVKEYELEPMAYVASSHALNHYLQKLDGIPPTAILIGVDEDLSITLIQSGKILGSKIAKQGEDLAQTIELQLSHFSDLESLPSKVLLYSQALTSEKLERIKDQLTTHNFMSRLPFLHIPKIELLPPGVLNKAIILAGSSEINPDVNLNRSFASEPLTLSAPSPLGRFKTATEDTIQDTNTETNLTQPKPPLMGEEAIEEVFEPLLDSEKKGLKLIKHYLLGLTHLPIFSKIKLPQKGKFFLPLLFLVVLIFAYLFLSQAVVTIYVEPKLLTKEAEIIADPQVKTADIEKGIIPGVVASKTVSGSAKDRATGKKEIGESAKGVVAIYNQTDAPKTFSAGTVLVGPNSLKFTLDSAVTVASQSSLLTGKTYGKGTGSATAVTIGPDSNIAAGSQLTIQGQDNNSYNGSVDTAFTGGTSKEVTVVTTEDQKKLQQELTDQLKKKAAEEIQAGLTDGKKVIPDGLSASKTDLNFSKRVNDQASEFSLNATVTFKGTAYSDNDLKTIVAKLVETNVPDNFLLNLADTETQAEVARIEKDGRLVFKAFFKAKLIPKIDEGALKKKIKGQGVNSVAEQLRGMENVLGSDIKLSPPLPQQFARLPLLASRIKIIVTIK